MEGGVKNDKGPSVDDHNCGHVAVAVAVIVGVAEDRDTEG